MNTEKQVFNKLFSQEKVELASQQYEFAKKAPDILKEIVKNENLVSKYGLKVNDQKMSYIKAYRELQAALDEAEKANAMAENDLAEIKSSLVAIGMDAKEADKITGFKQASDKVVSMKDWIKKSRTMYSSLNLS